MFNNRIYNLRNPIDRAEILAELDDDEEYFGEDESDMSYEEEESYSESVGDENEFNELTSPSDRGESFVRDLLGKDYRSLNDDLEEEAFMFSDDNASESEDEDYVYCFDSEMNISVPVNTYKVHQPKTLKDAAENLVKINLLRSEGRKYLSAKREYVNSLPVELKYSVLNRILTDENLKMQIRLDILKVFLDKRTKFFSMILPPKCCAIFRHMETRIPCLVFKTILKLIPKLAPNIETIDFTPFFTTSDLKEDFKFLLKKCTKLKSLRLNGAHENCPIFDLIFTDFNSLDKEVKIGLKKIKIYNLRRLFPLDSTNMPCSLRKLSNIFIRLPNLESLGDKHSLGPVINCYVKFNNTPLNLTVIHDYKTNLTTFENFAKFCPKVKYISLYNPQKNVVENLYKLPSLTEIEMVIFDNIELINYLTLNGKKITKLELCNNKPKIDEKLLRQLCPNLKNYTHTDYEL